MTGFRRAMPTASPPGDPGGPSGHFRFLTASFPPAVHSVPGPGREDYEFVIPRPSLCQADAVTVKALHGRRVGSVHAAKPRSPGTRDRAAARCPDAMSVSRHRPSRTGGKAGAGIGTAGPSVVNGTPPGGFPGQGAEVDNGQPAPAGAGTEPYRSEKESRHDMARMRACGCPAPGAEPFAVPTIPADLPSASGVLVPLYARVPGLLRPPVACPSGTTRDRAPGAPTLTHSRTNTFGGDHVLLQP